MGKKKKSRSKYQWNKRTKASLEEHKRALVSFHSKLWSVITPSQLSNKNYAEQAAWHCLDNPRVKGSFLFINRRLFSKRTLGEKAAKPRQTRNYKASVKADSS